MINHVTVGKCSRCSRGNESLRGCNRYIAYIFPPASSRTVLIILGMHHSGIGGGGFMLVRDSNGNYESIGRIYLSPSANIPTHLQTDFRETAPAAAFQDMYQGNANGSVSGGLASGVPGEVLGLETLHQKYGVCKVSINM